MNPYRHFIPSFVLIFLFGFSTLSAQVIYDDSLAVAPAESLLTMQKDTIAIDTVIIKKKPKLIPPKLNVTAFDIGEKLIFKIRYGFIKAGNAEMKVMKKTRLRGREVYHLQTTASSVPFFDAFYKVRDVVNSFVATDGFYSLRFEKKLREGDYYVDQFVDYYQEDSLAALEFIRYEDSDLNIRDRKQREMTVPPFINDILSSFYYVRNLDLQVGKSVFISNHEKDKVYDLEIKVYKKETIDVEAGEFRCIVVEPLLKGEGIFKQDGRLKIWLTDDDKKIPVQMKTKIAIGSLTTELVKIEGVRGRISAQE